MIVSAHHAREYSINCNPMVGFESDPPGCEAEIKPPYHHAPCKMLFTK